MKSSFTTGLLIHQEIEKAKKQLDLYKIALDENRDNQESLAYKLLAQSYTELQDKYEKLRIVRYVQAPPGM